MRIFLLDKSYSGEEIYPLKKREIQYLEKVLRMEDGITFTAKDSTENYYTATLLKGGLLSLSPTTSPEDNMIEVKIVLVHLQHSFLSFMRRMAEIVCLCGI